MSHKKIEYGQLVEQALRTVVRDVLGRLSRNEVPPPHHFYVTFRTDHPGVIIPDYLHERYPNEMTIVLQHQYWDLDVEEDRFSVKLSFNEVPENLIVPFAAIKVFADPGVEFGLQFTLDGSGEEAAQALPLHRPPALREVKDDAPAEVPEGGAEIVTLDRFRKK